MVLLLGPLFSIIPLTARLKLEPCIWEKSFICLNPLTQIWEPASQVTAGLALMVLPSQQDLLVLAVSVLPMAARTWSKRFFKAKMTYLHSKSHADHQPHYLGITGRASASSHQKRPHISPFPVTLVSGDTLTAQSRSNQASLKWACRYSHHGPLDPLRGQLSSSRKPEKNVAESWSWFKTTLLNGGLLPTSRWISPAERRKSLPHYCPHPTSASSEQE